MDYQVEIKKITSKIRVVRKSKHMTVQELAYRCDIERANLSRIEAGRSNPTVKTLCRICQALGITLQDIVN